MDSTTFQIPAMKAADVEGIKLGLSDIPGVRTVDIHPPTHSVTITWNDPCSLDLIWKRLEKMRFTPDFPQPF